MDSIKKILKTNKYYYDTNTINDELKSLIILSNEG